MGGALTNMLKKPDLVDVVDLKLVSYLILLYVYLPHPPPHRPPPPLSCFFR